MPISLLELARESFFRPRTAAPHLLGLNLSRNVIIQAAMLLAVLTVLSQYLLFVFVQHKPPTFGGSNFRCLCSMWQCNSLQPLSLAKSL